MHSVLTGQRRNILLSSASENLNKRKGFWDLLTAFHWAFKDMPHVSLIIAGDGGRNAATQKVNSAPPPARAGKTDRPPVTGRIVRVAGYLRCFCTGLLCGDIRHRIHRSNGNRLTAIGTICGGPEDIITLESGFIRPGDADALAAKMKTLYDTYESFDKEKIRQSIVSRFDFQLAGQKLRQVYSEALEMSKPQKHRNHESYSHRLFSIRPSGNVL